VTVKLYVEGGGDRNKALQTRCRYGFTEFLKKAGLKDRMPRVVACGGRREAYMSFRTSQRNSGANDFPILLVDSEGPVTVRDPWQHVKLRPGDGWDCPGGASGDQIHLMTQAMEAWFHADKDALARYYGQDFRAASLRQQKDIENIPKNELFAGMRQATRDCKKGEYSKGEHSFQILAVIDPAKVRDASAHASMLLDVLDRVCMSSGDV
jgi:hypothetical protein